MRVRPAVLVLVALSACAAPGTERAPASSAERAHPGADPALLGAPQGAPDVLPIEQVSVRVHRVADGRFTIVEFLSPGLTEAEKVALRLALEEGKLRPAGQGASGDESWITTLRSTPAR